MCMVCVCVCMLGRAGHPDWILMGAACLALSFVLTVDCSVLAGMFQQRQSFDTAVDVVAIGLKHDCRSLGYCRRRLGATLYAQMWWDTTAAEEALSDFKS